MFPRRPSETPKQPDPIVHDLAGVGFSLAWDWSLVDDGDQFVCRSSLPIGDSFSDASEWSWSLLLKNCSNLCHVLFVYQRSYNGWWWVDTWHPIVLSVCVCQSLVSFFFLFCWQITFVALYAKLLKIKVSATFCSLSVSVLVLLTGSGSADLLLFCTVFCWILLLLLNNAAGAESCCWNDVLLLMLLAYC